MITGRKRWLSAVLAEFLSGREENYLGPLTVIELVDLFYPYFCGKIVKGSELDRDTLGKKLESLKTIADNSDIIAVRGNSEDERQYNYRDLASRAKLALQDCSGFYNCMFTMAIVDYIQGDFTAYENCFLPMLQQKIPGAFASGILPVGNLYNSSGTKYTPYILPKVSSAKYSSKYTMNSLYPSATSYTKMASTRSA